MLNKEIANHFKLLGKLMELHGENAFKTRTYSNAAFQIGRLEKPLTTIPLEEVAAMKGFGKAVVSKIEVLLKTGQFPQLEKLAAETPPGLLALLNLKGIGAKKLGVLWQELGIESAGELLYACEENRLTMLKGFGDKTQNNIKEAIKYFQQNQNKYHYAYIEMVATNLLNDLKEAGFEQLSFTGALRRKVEVLEQIELVVATDDKTALQTFLKKAVAAVEQNEHKFTGKTIEGVPFIIYTTSTNKFAGLLFISSASQAHLNKIKIEQTAIEDFETEQAIYESLKLPYIEPELREGLDEVELAKNNQLPNLIKPADIKGVVHNHSVYSDGSNTVEEMAQACISLGYQYFVISDHSKAAFYAGGLTEAEIEAQHKEVEELNSQLGDFKIFKSIECDILNDGSLDYDDSTLDSFDLVIASIHSNLKMEESKATDRIIKAIENPYTNILGHLTGRLLLSRAGYPIDYKKVIDACAANNVVIELNANPHRLDIDWRWMPYALNKGIKISINPDAHNIAGINDIYYGVCAARKGYLTPEQTLNAQPADVFINWLKK